MKTFSGKEMAGILLVAVVLVAGTLIVAGQKGYGPFVRKHTRETHAPGAKVEVKKEIYQCPMHPSYTSNKPGKCPICGMDLVKVEQEAAAETGHEGHEHASTPSAPTEPREEIYSCPMHPSYTSPKPGKCPICGMDLVKVEKPEEATAEQMGDLPKGFGMVSLSEGKRQEIGVRTTPVTKGTLARSIRAPAIVKMDERKVKQVQSKIQGWIERLNVNFTGQYVKQGQALMAIYSPDLVSTQEEYLLALRNLQSLEGAEPFIRDGAQNLVDAARRRLRFWDISSAQIRRLEESGEPMKTLTLFSPVKGYVIENNARQGMEVSPGMMLYTIADLSKVWVFASVYEQDLALIEKGMTVVFYANAYPDRTFMGEVSYINPELEMESRTAKVRIELPNPDMLLKPEMYGEAMLVADVPETLLVPSSALMDSGEVQIVYVEVEPGHYMPREVKVGIRTSEQAQILDGLKEGELVVVEGNFMLDSESRLRAARSGSQDTATGHQH